MHAQYTESSDLHEHLHVVPLVRGASHEEVVAAVKDSADGQIRTVRVYCEPLAEEMSHDKL